MTDRYTIAELGLAKGTPRPVAEAMLAMERKIERLEAENKRLREVLGRVKGCLSADWQHDTLCLQHMVAFALTLLDEGKHDTANNTN